MLVHVPRQTRNDSRCQRLRDEGDVRVRHGGAQCTPRRHGTEEIAEPGRAAKQPDTRSAAT
jgi:hypothetical protein